MEEEIRSEREEPVPGPIEARPGEPLPESAPPPYPLRPPSEDPRWALWTVRVWAGIALSGLIFFIALLILGIFYD
jgi:hypothetical protein